MTTWTLSPGWRTHCATAGDPSAQPGRRRRRRGAHGPGIGFGPGGPRIGGRRAGRGDIRAAILTLLALEPMHGYQLIQEITDRTDGAWRPSPGSVYPTLQQLADEELVVESATATGKRVYALTDAGAALSAETTAPWDTAGELEDATLAALRDVALQVLAATRQVAEAGTREQVKSARRILRDTRKQLYRLLADS